MAPAQRSHQAPMNLRVFLAVVATALIAALGWWLQSRIHPEQQARERIAKGTPDYFIEHFTATGMNQQGQLDNRLSADSLLHYPDDGHSDLTRPRMTFFRKDGAPWQADAARGNISGDNKVVNLLGKVHIQRDASATNRAITVNTSNLRVRPDDNYAETPEHAVIRSEGSTLQGTGMHAWFGAGRLQLLSKVQGTYQHDNP